MALIIVTLVTTLATSMIWQQWRAVQVESAERARAQAAWMLTGALDWAELILKEDGRSNRATPHDHLGEPWAVPLAEARVSTFLAVDKDNTDDAPDAFLSGAIVDAQSMYNLRNLVGPDGKVVKEQFDILLRLCDRVSVGPSTALRLANGLRDAVRPGMDSKPEMTDENPDPPLLPERVDQLTWVGVDKESLQRLKPYVTLLPSPQGQNGVQPPPTTININTAPREVIAAVLNIDPPLAESLVQTRARTPFKTMDEVVAKLAPGHVLVPNSVNVTTKHFVVSGRLRLGDQVLEQRSLVQREDTKVTPLTREWVNSNDPG